MKPDSPATPRVAALFVHPLKSARPVPVSRMPLDALGAVGDRRWMLVDPDGRFISQRERARLALVQAALPMTDGMIVADGPLTLRAPGLDAITVERADHVPPRAVSIWHDTVDMADAGDEAAAWCSEAMETPCRLVHLTAATRRPLAAKYAGPLDYATRTVAVTDGAPLLLLGQGSLDALNQRLAQGGSPALGVERFRPNVLLDGIGAHDEDGWSRVRIGEVELGVGSQCPRCVVTTIDQERLDRSVEPLRTLATYRRDADGGVMFGMNVTHAAPGVLHVGDEVVPLALR